MMSELVDSIFTEAEPQNSVQSVTSDVDPADLTSLPDDQRPMQSSEEGADSPMQSSEECADSTKTEVAATASKRRSANAGRSKKCRVRVSPSLAS